MNRLLLGLLMLLCANAWAGEIDLVAHGLSAHLRVRTVYDQHQECSQTRQDDRHAHVDCRTVVDSHKEPYESLNYGAGLRYGFNDNYAAQVGVYRNSYDRTSVYAVGEALYRVAPHTRIGIAGGLVNGYIYHDGQFTVMGALTVRQQVSDRVEVVARVIPPVHPKVAGAVALELAYRIR